MPAGRYSDTSLLASMGSHCAVVTSPAGVNRRTTLLPVSATRAVPSRNTAIPEGVSNRAERARAVAKPGPAPAGDGRHEPGAVDHADGVVVGIRNEQMDGRGFHSFLPAVLLDPWQKAAEP